MTFKSVNIRFLENTPVKSIPWAYLVLTRILHYTPSKTSLLKDSSVFRHPQKLRLAETITEKAFLFCVISILV